MSTLSGQWKRVGEVRELYLGTDPTLLQVSSAFRDYKTPLGICVSFGFCMGSSVVETLGRIQEALAIELTEFERLSSEPSATLEAIASIESVILKLRTAKEFLRCGSYQTNRLIEQLA